MLCVKIIGWVVETWHLRLVDNFNLQVFVENLCTKQEENEVEVRGPPVSKAFDEQGNPTKVLLAFPAFPFFWLLLFFRNFFLHMTTCDAWTLQKRWSTVFIRHGYGYWILLWFFSLEKDTARQDLRLHLVRDSEEFRHWQQSSFIGKCNTFLSGSEESK